MSTSGLQEFIGNNTPMDTRGSTDVVGDAHQVKSRTVLAPAGAQSMDLVIQMENQLSGVLSIAYQNMGSKGARKFVPLNRVA